MTVGGGNDQWGELLAAAQAGDASAYRDFLTNVTPFVRALARRRIRTEDAIEDVVQDVLLTVHRVRHTYEPGRPVAPWLTAITARRSIDSLRKRGRGAAREIHDPIAYETFPEPEANKTEAGDSARQLERMMGDLSPRQKEAVELVKLKEMSLVEASAISGQTVASLKVNIHRAIKRMRLSAARDGGE